MLFNPEQFYTEEEIDAIAKANGLTITDCLKDDKELTLDDQDGEGEPLYQFGLQDDGTFMLTNFPELEQFLRDKDFQLAIKTIYMALTASWIDNGNISANATRDAVVLNLSALTGKFPDTITKEVEQQVNDLQ